MQSLLETIGTHVRCTRTLPFYTTINGRNAKWVIHRGECASARYLVIGEAPGKEELAVGRPFSGARGAIFDELVAKACSDMGTRTTLNDHFLVTHCVFAMPPRNRDPRAHELEAYATYLKAIVEQMRPEAIICLGRFSASLVQHGFNVKRMYGRPASYTFSQMEPAPDKMVQVRKVEGEVANVLIELRDRTTWMCRQVTMTDPGYFLRRGVSSSSCELQKAAWAKQLALALVQIGARVPLDQPSIKPFVVTGSSCEEPHQHPNYTTSVLEMETDLVTDTHMQRCIRIRAERPPSAEAPFVACVRDISYDRRDNHFCFYTTTSAGLSACVRLKGFKFPFYVKPHPAFFDEAKRGLAVSTELADTVAHGIKQKFEDRWRWYTRYRAQPHILCTSTVSCVPVLNRVVLQRGYQGSGSTFLRFEVNHFDLVHDVLLELKGMVVAYTEGPAQELVVCEAKYDPVQMLTYEMRIRMSCWVQFAPGTLAFSQPPDAYGVQVLGECDLGITPDALQCLSHTTAQRITDTLTSADHAPSVREAIDIECAGRGTKFPNALCDPVITICVTIQLKTQHTKYHSRQSEEDDLDHPYEELLLSREEEWQKARHANATDDRDSRWRLWREELRQERKKMRAKICAWPDEQSGYYEVGFQLGVCDMVTEVPHARKRIYQFADEKLMLECWGRFQQMVAPDYLVGHNVKRFDLEYLLTRMRVLQVSITRLGRDLNECLRVDKRKFVSRAYGERVITEFCGLAGVTIIDTLDVYLREKKLNSYRLDALAQLFLMSRKDDVPYAALPGLFRGSDGDRRRIVEYCFRDARLTDLLVNLDAWDVNMTEFARVQGTVSENGIYVRGQQVKVLSAAMHRNVAEGHHVLVETPDWETSKRNETVIETWLLQNEGGMPERQGNEDRTVDSVGTAEANSVLVRLGVAPSGQAGKDAAPSPPQPPVKRKLQSVISAFFSLSRGENDSRLVGSKTEKEMREAWHLRKRGKGKRARERKPKTHEEMVRRDLKRMREELDEGQTKLSALSAREVSYQGATVMDAVPGLHYLLPVICVDFSSLYPSIMLRYNISPDTKLYESDLGRMRTSAGETVTAAMCHRSPITGRNKRTGQVEQVYFIRSEHWRGLLCATEKDLLAARSVAKKQKAAVDESIESPPRSDIWVENPDYDPVKLTVFDGRQAQIKVVCNSMYGAMGATGHLGDKDCAAAVTAWGRVSIELTRDVLIQRYSAVCKGGDTDSVFMIFPGFADGVVVGDDQKSVRIETVAEAEAFSKELEQFINAYFYDGERPDGERQYMKICYEKAMYPMLVLAKKRYCGIIHEKGKRGRFFSKGMETIRRDALPFTKSTMQTVFDKILVQRKSGEELAAYQERMRARVQEACVYIKQRARQLLEGKVQLLDLIMSKQLSREHYADQSQPHLTVKRKMTERGLEPPRLGERVPFVFTVLPKDPKTNKLRKGYEKAEHPNHAIYEDLPIDYAHYLLKKFIKPVLRVMKHVLRDEMVYRLVRSRTVRTVVGGRKLLSGTTAEVTGKEIENETEKFLFEKAPARTKRKADPQTCYMSSRRIVDAKHSVEYSPLVRTVRRYAQTEGKCVSARRRIEAVERKHESVDTALQGAISALTQQHARYQKRLSICRACVKMEHVQCAAYQCKDYYPRIIAEGKTKRIAQSLDVLVTDIEDLVAENSYFIKTL